jgi:hypothetical protein
MNAVTEIPDRLPPSADRLYTQIAVTSELHKDAIRHRPRLAVRPRTEFHLDEIRDDVIRGGRSVRLLLTSERRVVLAAVAEITVYP